MDSRPELGIWLSAEQVNAMLEHLYSSPIPYRYSVPLIRVLEGAKNPPSNSDTEMTGKG
jgi:hypothetical protein